MDAPHTDVRNGKPDAATEPVSHDRCRAVADALARVGDKWTVIVIGTLGQNGPLRYNELGRQVEGISQRMLTLTLKGLEQDGLVRRTMYPTIPPRVDYELTDLGRTLIEPLKGIFDWTMKNRDAMDQARARYAEEQAKKPLW